MSPRNPRSKSAANFISEWFGHRMYPEVVGTAGSLIDQRTQRCPFLSAATGETRQCVKASNSRGVCTINSSSNGVRQDWVVCPFRAFDTQATEAVASRLFGSDQHLRQFSAPSLVVRERQEEVFSLLSQGTRVLVYFNTKIGGEIGVSATVRSPEVAFDTTFVELLPVDGGVMLGRFAVMETQTMDFHGSYGHAVRKLLHGLDLHPETFPRQVQENQWWLGDRIEGPNIANVFKRTFWQLMFKFEMALSPDCAGVALTIPAAVWDSWQRFLGAPTLDIEGENVFVLRAPGQPEDRLTSWIYVFDFDSSSPISPSPMRIAKVIRTSAGALAHHAMYEAPMAAISQLDRGIYPALKARLAKYLPLRIFTPERAAASGTVHIDEDPRPIDEILEEG